MLAYRLVAHGIGGRTVCELNEGMDVDEFLTWAAYFAIDPPVGQRADIHTAMMMAQQFNINRGKNKGARKPADFMMRWYKPPKPEMDARDLKWAAMQQYIALGGDPRELEP